MTYCKKVAYGNLENTFIHTVSCGKVDCNNQFLFDKMSKTGSINRWFQGSRDKKCYGNILLRVSGLLMREHFVT